MEIIDLASGKSVWLGMEYYQQNKVRTYSENEDETYRGEVVGSGAENYHVHLDLNHPRKSTCDCPLTKF